MLLLLLSSLCCLQLLYMVGLPFPLRWTVRAAMQLLHQHTRRKIRMCRATDVPRRLPSQLRSHKLSLAAGLDNWAFLETQSYVGPEVAAMDSGGYFADAAGLADAGSAAGAGSVVGSELDPYTPRTPKMRAPGARFRWRSRRTKDLQGGGAGLAGGGGGRQQLRVRLLRHGALVLCGVVGLMLAYLLVLRQFSPVVAVEPLVHRLAAGLRRA